MKRLAGQQQFSDACGQGLGGRMTHIANRRGFDGGATRTLAKQGKRRGRASESKKSALGALAALVLLAMGADAAAQSFQVTCPGSTITHPVTHPGVSNNIEPAYTGPTTLISTVASEGSNPVTGYLVPSANVNGAIKCQQVSGGDGYATMADGTQIYTFSFGPLSGLADIANGLPGTEFPGVFNSPYLLPNSAPPGYNGPSQAATVALPPGYPAVPAGGVQYNGAIGLSVDVTNAVNIYQISEGVIPGYTPAGGPNNANTVLVVLNSPSTFKVGDPVTIGQGTASSTSGDLAGYTGTFTVTGINPPTALADLPASYAFTYQLPATAATTGLALVTASSDATASAGPVVDGHVDPREIMDIAVMNGNSPGPLKAIDEDDEFFDTLTNVGMIQRPDLFEQHTIHFHGYPNASPFYDGVPDASVAIWIGASFSYYYLAPDAGTYFWHCHITPPEHLQMGMVGQLYVRPRQNRVPTTNTLYQGLAWQQADLRTACNNGSSYVPAPYVSGVTYSAGSSTMSAVATPINDILCTNPLPAPDASGVADHGVYGGYSGGVTKMYAYNDGDGSTYYDVELALQSMGYDPNFHFVGMTFNGEPFADMKDKYFLLNGRSYPDTINPGTLATSTAGGAAAFTTPTSDGVPHFLQPMNALVTLKVGQRALIRYSELNVSEYKTLASLGIPMTVVGWNAKLLRDQAGYNTAYVTNSVTLGGGESADMILDTCLVRSNPADPSSTCTTSIPAGTYYLYSSNLDHLSNDAENFGGMLTEVHVIATN